MFKIDQSFVRGQLPEFAMLESNRNEVYKLRDHSPAQSRLDLFPSIQLD